MSALALKIAVQLGEGGEARNHFTIGLDSLRLSLLHKGLSMTETAQRQGTAHSNWFWYHRTGTSI